MHHNSFIDNRARAHEPATNGVLSRERVLALVLLALTVGAFVLCYFMIQPFLAALAWALALAIMTRPLHTWLVRYVKQPDIAAGIAVFCVVVLLVLPTYFVIHSMTQEAGQTIASVQEGAQSWKEKLATEPRLLEVVEWADANFNVSGEIPRAVNALVGDVMPLLSGSVWAIMQLLLVLLSLFYFFRDRHRALHAVRGLLPLNNEEADRLFKRIDDTVHATLYGTLLCAAVQGFMGGLMFWLLGLPAPVTWGVVMGLLAVVPYLGTFVIWAPAAATLAFQGHWGKAGILVGWGVIAIGLIDNLLYPVFVGKRLRMHSLLALFAILGGLAVFGGSGLVLGPVLVGVTFVLIDVWRERLADGKPAEDGVNEGGGTPQAVANGRTEPART